MQTVAFGCSYCYCYCCCYDTDSTVVGSGSVLTVDSAVDPVAAVNYDSRVLEGGRIWYWKWYWLW